MKIVFEKDWDKIAGKVKRTHPNFRKLNNFLMKKLTEVNDIYFGLALAALVGVVIIGGIESLGKVTGRIVPVLYSALGHPRNFSRLFDIIPPVHHSFSRVLI